MEFLIVVIILFSVGISAVLFHLVSYLYVCVHGCRRSRCHRHHQCLLIGDRKPSSSPLFTCVTFCFCILRKVGLEWRCWRCVFYRRCRLFRAGEGHPLQYRDVMVMTSKYSQLQDDVRDDAGRVTSRASGFVVGLRDKGVPVCELERIDRVGGGTRVGSRVPDVAAVDRAGWESRVGEVAVSRTDRVTVADWRCVQGLERRVVVWVTDYREEDWPAVDPHHGLVGMSRCTTQLVTVAPPR